MTRFSSLALAAVIAVAALSCGPSDSGKFTDYRAFTDHYQIRVSALPMPPLAREPALFKLVIRDKDTQAPIQGGEGILYAETRQGVKAWDKLKPGQELGTYTAKLNFIVSGEWAMGLRFRRDSTHALEQADWLQSVLPDTSSIP